LHGLDIAALPNLSHLADIGIELLLFSVGLKLKPRSLIRSEVLSVGGSHLLLVTGISAFVFLAMGERITGGVVLGASLAFSSTVLAIKVLDDSRELSSLHGRDVISILILQDIVAIGLLAFAEGKQLTPWAFILLLLPLLRPLAHRLLTVSRADELRLLLGVSLALGGGVLAENLGISPDIGALLTGVMLAAHPKIDDLSDKLWSLKEVFLVTFFLQIGLTEFPTQEQALTALKLLALLPLQGGLFFVLFVLAGLRARTAFVSSLALMTYSEFALITTGAVVNANLLPEEWKSIISLAVAGSLAIAAPLNRYSHRLFSWAEPVLIPFEKKSGHPDRLPESFALRNGWLSEWDVPAFPPIWRCTHRKSAWWDWIADPTVLENLLAKGKRVVYGDAEDTELWDRLPLERIKGVILTVPVFEVRCAAISQLRKRGFTGQIGTISYYFEEEQELIRLGANLIIHPLVEAGNQLVKQILDNDED
jgi:glutathione-regulated potassium-efflux system ancillary protein KefC